MSDKKFKDLETQLKRIGCNFQFWGRSELKELAHVLLPGEIVEHVVNGSYERGFALLAATNQRVLLIDKKPMYLTLEDIRFDMMAEIDYNHRLMSANILICTPNKELRFTGYNHDRLRKLFHFVQTRVMAIREHYAHQSQVNQSQPNQQFSYQPQASQYQMSDQQVSYQPAGQLQFHQEQQPAMPVQQTMDAANESNVPTEPIYQFQRHHVPPVISAYTRLPIMSRQRRFLGSRAMNSSMPSNL